MTDNGKKTILAADDALSSRAIIKKLFAGKYEVLEAENGRRVLEILRARPDVSVVVLDIFMPEMNGLDVLSAMQKDETLKAIPVIVMTGSSDEATQMQALSCGAMDVLYKPINPQLTQKRVENLISRMDTVRLAERNRIIERELREADTDTVSGIYNKNAFLRHVRQYLLEHPNGDYILLRWDIDNFKIYNDVYGVEAGNEYLRNIGNYYKACAGGSSSIHFYARYEADHFTCLVDAEAFDPQDMLGQLNACLQGNSLYTFDYAPRIGLYRIDDTSLDVALMCDRALLALKSIKNVYGRYFAWYKSAMRDVLVREHDIVNSIRSALASHQFSVYFQPQYDYTSGALTGAEALVRWIHPDKGVIPPSEFIPLLEKNGFIYELDRYVWDQTCAYIVRWRNSGIHMPAISISVNISRRDLYQWDIVKHISSLPKKYGIPASMLHLEITESAYIDNPSRVVKVLSLLRKQGFCVEMDDFGSGYSSLNTLKNMPVDVLKLDMKFLADNTVSSRGGIILSSVIRMAHEIELPVIAEGVESKRQADYLKSIGCHYMQGYYFSRPVPPEEFEKLLLGSSIASLQTAYNAIGTDGAADFMDADTQSSLLFNSYVGGAAIVEYRAGSVAALRVNDRFFETLRIDCRKYADCQFSMLDCFTPDSRAGIVAALDAAIASGKETECEMCVALTDKDDYVWAGCRLRCLTKKVESYLFYMSLEDITDKKRAQRELSQTKQMLNNVIDAIPGGVATYEVREDGFYLVYASDGAAALSGLTAEEYRRFVKEKKSIAMLHPGDDSLTLSAIEGAAKNGAGVNINCRVLRRHRGYIRVNLQGRTIGEQDGYPLFCAVFRDLSDTTDMCRETPVKAENVPG